MTYPLPKVIKNCLLTLNNIRIEWNGPDTVYISYAKTRPSDPVRVELRFARPTGIWLLYACNEHLSDAQWETMQQYLIQNQQVLVDVNK